MRKELKTIKTLTAADALALTAALGSLRRQIAPSRTDKIVVEVSQDDQKACRAKSPGREIAAQAEAWEALRVDVRNAIRSGLFGDYRTGQMTPHSSRSASIGCRRDAFHAGA